MSKITNDGLTYDNCGCQFVKGLRCLHTYESAVLRLGLCCCCCFSAISPSWFYCRWHNYVLLRQQSVSTYLLYITCVIYEYLLRQTDITSQSSERAQPRSIRADRECLPRVIDVTTDTFDPIHGHGSQLKALQRAWLG